MRTPDKWFDRPGDLTYEEMVLVLRNYPVAQIGWGERTWISLGDIEKNVGVRIGALKKFLNGDLHAFGKTRKYRLMRLLRHLEAGQVDRIAGELIVRPEREPAKVHVYSIALPVDRHGRLKPTMVRGPAPKVANNMPNLFASFRGFALPMAGKEDDGIQTYGQDRSCLP